MPSRPWTRDELIQTLKLYCLTPFGRIHNRNPAIVKLAEEIGRTPSAIALKMTNFASLDPTIARSGMSNYSKLDKTVWDEFFANMDEILNQTNDIATDNEFGEPQRKFTHAPKVGFDAMRVTKTRINQNFFRKLILASYDNQCALTKIDAPELLIASHIVPWSVDTSARMKPTNGICLNALHDRAFDEGLISFSEDFSVLYSSKMPTATKETLKSFGAEKLRLPSRFIPDKEFLDYHRREIFTA